MRSLSNALLSFSRSQKEVSFKELGNQWIASSAWLPTFAVNVLLFRELQYFFFNFLIALKYDNHQLANSEIFLATDIFFQVRPNSTFWNYTVGF